MSEDRNEKLNTPDESNSSYTVDEILSEFSSSRSHQVLPFPSQEEENSHEQERDFSPPAAPRPAERPRKKAEVVHLHSDPPPFSLREKLRSLSRKADEYADQMYQQAEPTPSELEAEELIPGVDEEILPDEEEYETSPRRRLFRTPPPPRDTAPADLAARYRHGLQISRLRLLPCFLLALIATYVTCGFPLPMSLFPDAAVSDYELRFLCVLASLMVSILLCIDIVFSGLLHLFTLKPNVETLCALSALVTVADAFTMPSLGMRQDSLPFAAPVCFILFFNLWGRFLKYRADYQSCKIASQSKSPFLLTVDDSKWSAKPAYTKWSGPFRGFGSQIQSPDWAQKVYRVAAPLLILLCVVFSYLASAGREQNNQFLWAFSATLTAATTFSAPLVYGLPYQRLAKRLSRSNASLAGWPGVERCGGHSVLVTDSDLFPTGSAKLNGIKIFGHFSTEKVIAYTSTLIRASHCGLEKAFSDLMKAQNALYRPCSGLTFHEGGITGVIHSQEVIVGTASFLRLMNVELPQGLHVKSALFCAIQGELAGIFAVYYDLREDVSHSLTTLMSNRMSPLLATRDPNLIPSLLKQKFKLPAERMEFPSVDRRMELSDPEQDHSETITAVILREGLFPYTEAAVGASRLRSAARIGSLLSVLGGLLGCLLTFYLSFSDAYRSLSPTALLVFLITWLIPQLMLGDWVTRY